MNIAYSILWYILPHHSGKKSQVKLSSMGDYLGNYLNALKMSLSSNQPGNSAKVTMRKGLLQWLFKEEDVTPRQESGERILGQDKTEQWFGGNTEVAYTCLIEFFTSFSSLNLCVSRHVFIFWIFPFFLSSGSFLWGSILDFYRNLLFVSFWAVTQDLGPAYTPGGQPPCYEPLPPLSWMLQRHHLKILNEFLTRSTRFSWGFGSHRFYTCPIDRI